MNEKSQVIENESRNSSTFWLVVGGIIFFILLAIGSYVHGVIFDGKYIDTTNKQTIVNSLSKIKKMNLDYNNVFETRKFGDALLVVYGSDKIYFHELYYKIKGRKNRYRFAVRTGSSDQSIYMGLCSVDKTKACFVACTPSEKKAKYYTLSCGDFFVKRDIVRGKKTFDIYVNDEIEKSRSMPVVKWYDENGKELEFYY